jgi:hypothetical protein
LKKLSNKAARLAARNPKFSARLRGRAVGPEVTASGKAAGESSALNIWALAALGLAGGAAAAVAPGRAERAAGQAAAAPGDGAPGTALEQAQAALPAATGSALSPALEALVQQLAAEAAAQPVAGGDAAAEAVPGTQEPATASSAEPAAEAAAAEAAAEITRAAEALADAALPGEAVVLAQAAGAVGGVGAGSAAPAAGAAAGAAASGTAGAAGAAVGAVAAAGATAALGVVAVAAVAVTVAVASSGSGDPVTTAATDTTKPTATIALSDTALKAGETATVTITFSEAVTGFSSAQDVTVQSGTLSAMTSSDGGKTWTGTFTPTADLEDATNVISLATSYADAAGNAGEAAQSDNYLVDTKAPTVALTTDDAALNIGDDAKITLTFSEAPASLPTVTPSAGTLGTFTAVPGSNGLVYAATLTPPADTAAATISFTIGAWADAAGNSGSTTAVATVAADTQLPAYQTVEVHSNGGTAPGTIELIYSEPMSAADLPPPTAFTVSFNGEPATPTSVTASGTTVTLTFEPGVIVAGPLFLNVSYSDPTGADDAVAVQDAAGNDAADLLIASGIAADGYIRGAQMYLEEPDGDLVPLAGVVTDDFGNFFLPAGANPQNYPLVAVGGVNIDTGVPNTTPLKAPAGSTTINPLTTLVQAVVASSGGTVDAAAAAKTVADTLGLTLPLGQTLTNFDPISVGNTSTDPVVRQAAVEAQKAAAQIATVVALASSDAEANDDAGTTVISNLASQIQAASAAESTVSLADASTLGNALAGTGVSEAAQSTIADASAAIEQVDAATGNISQISAAQSQFLDTIAPASPTAAPDLQAQSDSGANTSDNVTNAVGLSVRVAFDTNATDGTAAVAGDRVRLLDGGVQVAEQPLSAQDIAAGRVDLSIFGVAEGTRTFTAQLVDQAGLASPVSSALTVTVDRTAPVAPTVGVVAGDDVISSVDAGAIVIGGAVEAGASVSVALGGNTRAATVNGGNWSYTVTADDIDAMGEGDETLSVTATDSAGNTSTAGTRAIAVDTTPPEATAAITGALDNVPSGAENVPSGGSSNDNTLELSGTVAGTLAAGDRIVVYNGGTALGAAAASGSTWTFATAGLGNATHEFTARVEDANGNRGSAGTPYTVTVNAAVPSTTVVIAGASHDGGAVSGGITNDTTPVLAGTVSAALAGEQVVVYRNGVRLGVADGEGTAWTYAVGAAEGTGDDLTAGAHRFTAVVENIAGGNQGAKSAPLDLVVDLTPPPAPAFGVVAGNDQINGAEASLGVMLTGTVEAGASVSVTIGGVVRPATVNGDNWSTPLTSDDITNLGSGGQITVTARDAAGNPSAPTSRMVAMDTQGPEAPSIFDVAGNDIINAAERAAPSGVLLQGTVEEGAQVALTLTGSNGSRTLTANVNGEEWSYTLNAADYALLGQGEGKTVSVVARDAAGNLGSTGTRAFTIDTVAPTMAPLTLESDSGVKGDSRSNVEQPTFQFSAPGSTPTGFFQLLDTQGNAVAAPVAMSFSGGGGRPATPLATDGTYRVQVTASDGAGNTTTRTGTYTLDRSAPGVQSITDDETADKANIAGGPVVFTIAFTEGVTGFTADDVTVTGGVKGAFAAINSREYTLAVLPAPGSTADITVNVAAGVAEDIAGNASTAAASPATQGVDFAAPTATVVVSPAALRIGQQGTVTVTFSEPVTGFSKADLSAPSGTLGDMASTDGGRTWTGSFTPDVGTEDATNVVTLTAASYTDAAGNPGAGAVSANYAVDTRAPVFSSVTAATAPENTATTVAVYTASASDATPVSYALASGGSNDNARFDINATTGAVTFRAAPDFEVPADAGANNEYNLTITATDAAGNSTERSVSITAENVNEAPTLTSGPSASFAENGTGTVYTATATDPDANTTLSYSLGGADGNLFNIDPATGAVTFKAAPNFEAPADAGADNVYDITVTARDNGTGNLTDMKSVAITVTNVNEAPSVTSGASASFNENATGTVYTATGADPDAGTTLSYGLGGTDAAAFSIDPATGVVTFVSPPDFETKASYSIQVTATDNATSALNGSKAVTVIVNDLNEAPQREGTVPAQTAVNGQAYSLDVGPRFKDLDAGANGTLTFSATGLPGGLSIQPGTGLISGTASADRAPASVVVTATDGGGLSQTQSFALGVVSAPAIVGLAVDKPAAKSGTALVFTVTVSEPVTVTGTPTLTLDVGGQPLTATYSGGSGTSSLTFTATAAGGNDNSVTVTAIQLNGGTVIGNTTTQALLTSAVGQVVSNFVSDNSAPVFQDGASVTKNFAENGTGAVHGALVTDATGVSYTLEGADAGKFDVGAGGALTFKASPDSEQPGSQAGTNDYVVEITATDAVGLTAKQTVTVKVGNLNDNPVVLVDANAAGDTVAENVATGTVVGVTASASDADTGATITGYSLDSNAGGRFAIDPVTGVVRVAGALDHEIATSHTITLRANSSDGSTATQTLTIAVSNVNEAPTVGTVAAPAVTLGVPYQFNAGARFADVDANDVLTFSAQRLPGGLQIDPMTGVIYGTGAVEGTAAVSVTATDQAGLSATAQFTLTVQEGISFSFEGDTFTVPTAPLGDETFAVMWATQTGENSGLFRLETMSDTYDYELWVAVEDGEVVAHKAFATDAGFMQRSVNSLDGGIYFQVVNASLQREGSTGPVSGITQAKTGPATTLYAVDPAAVLSLLDAAATEDTLVDLPGVTKVRDFTRAELGVSNETTQADTVALLEGHLPGSYWAVTGALPGYVSSVVTPFTEAPGLSFLGRLDAQGNLPGGAPKALGGEITDAFAVVNTGLFVRTGATATSGEAAYHFNPVTGVLSQVSTAFFDSFAASGTEAGVFLPSDVTFLSGTQDGAGTAVNDTLGNPSASSTQRQWIAGGEGNDTLQGGAGADLLYGGPGGDSMVGGAGNDVLSGLGGDDRLQGQGGADTVYGGGGNDTIDGGADQDLARFAGLFSRYQVVVQNGIVTITDSLTGGDGVDTLSNVERFEFSDGVYKLNAGSTGLVADAVEITSALDGVTNLDVTSAIVLQASEPVTAVAGKKIRIMNDGGAGFRGEATDSDQTIDVGSAAVTIQGNLIIIRPGFNLDLANSYHVEIDAGAFLGAGGLKNAALVDATAIDFTTVTPGSGTSGVGAAALSQSMNVQTGAMQSSFKWLDIEGVGSPNSSSGTVVNIAGDNIALAFKDYTSAGAILSGNLANDGIGSPDFYVRATGFGLGDLVYVDNQNPSQPNALEITTVLASTPTNGVTQISFAGYFLSDSENSLNGLLEITLANSTAVFSDFNELQNLLQSIYPPVQSN